MNKIEQTLWALTMSTIILVWWEKVLANNEEIISITESPTWITTYEFREKTMWLLDEWTKPNSQNVIMVDLVDSKEIQTQVQNSIAKHQEIGAEQHKKELIEFWWFVTLWLSLWWIIAYINSLTSKGSKN